MADYFGLEAIAQRMNVETRTIQRWAKDQRFLMYRRRRGKHSYWYTNDELILRWESAKCVIDVTYRRREVRSPHCVTCTCRLATLVENEAKSEANVRNVHGEQSHPRA